MGAEELYDGGERERWVNNGRIYESDFAASDCNSGCNN